jgi:uncharacterized protein
VLFSRVIFDPKWAREPTVHRRKILAAFLTSASAIFSVTPATKTASAATADGAKVVYHLTDLDKVDFVLGNIRNHFEGMGGPNKVTIALVVHGPALKAFRSSDAGGDVSKRTDELSKSGLQMHACGNTMRALNITLKDSLPGFVAADKGGVVRIAELQSQGFIYLRP